MKTLNLKDSTWQKISQMRIDHMHKTVDDTLNYLLENNKDKGNKK